MTIQFRRTGLAALICAAALLTACGGGSPPTGSLPDDRLGPDPHAPEPTVPDTTPKDAPPRGDPPAGAGGRPLPAHVTVSGGYTGIGPAVSGQRPEFTDLGRTTETARQDIAVRSGQWRDRNGRDGSSSAGEVVRYIKSYQDLATREARRMGRGDAPLFFVDFGRQKTLRMHGAGPREAELVRTALQEINTALPWEHRILLGEDLTAPLLSPPFPPRGEIHLYFTNGKRNWPVYNDDPPDGDGVILGVGNPRHEGTNTVMAGWVIIDRDAAARVGLSEREQKHVIAHEVLHAYGIGAHADPSQYPNSLMTPTAENFDSVGPIYLTIDGEGVLAEMRLTPGARVSELDPGDLGDWTDTAFHLTGRLNLGNGSNDWVQFGAGHRNGLSKPWVHGRSPTGRIASNPEFAGSVSATWNGALLGFSGMGQTVAGDAQIRIHFGSPSPTGTADFDGLEYWSAGTHPGEPGSGTQWEDGDLDYTIRVTELGDFTEGFVSAFAPGDDPGIVTGAFVGSGHEGAAGVLEHPELSAGFAAKR